MYFIIILGTFLLGAGATYDEVDWMQAGQEELVRMLTQKPNQNVAKNVILFIGDGMGVSTVTAARIYRGQLNGRSGEEEILSFEKFPHVALAKTYNVDYMVPDSAGTATAFVCGVKARLGTLGVNQYVTRGNCTAVPGNEVDSMLKWSQQKGKSTGIVTTTRVTHATPAAAYAHSPNRNWETDSAVPSEYRSTCEDIASQLVTKNPDVNVILGGGRTYFLPDFEKDPEHTRRGKRQDGRNLIQEWVEEKTGRGVDHKYVWNQTEFDKVDPTSTDYLLGLFSPSHMQYEEYRKEDRAGEPSLAEMVQKSLQIMQKNDKGYFLYVEGGRIDHGHHSTKAKLAFKDTIAFADAVQVAMDMTQQEDTLIIVTADHSHVMTIAGYASRGNDILGLDDNSRSSLGTPYQTLSYANGPKSGFVNFSGQDIDFHDPAYRQRSLVPKSSETHSGEDVAIYSRGPMAHLLTGVHEQNYIAHVMAYSSCAGPYQHYCSDKQEEESKSSPIESHGNTNGAKHNVSTWKMILTPLMVLVHILLQNCSVSK